MFGLTTLNRPVGPRQARELWRTATAFYFQAFSAGLFALFVIVGSLFAGNGQLNTRILEPSAQTAMYYYLMNEARSAEGRALLLLEGGQTREAAILAWFAVGKATDAFLTARTGVVPTTTAMTPQWLDHVVSQDATLESLSQRYRDNVNQLLDACFYNGACGPETATLIRETEVYIKDVERLVNAGTPPKAP